MRNGVVPHPRNLGVLFLPPACLACPGRCWSASVGLEQAQPDLADRGEARHGVPAPVDGDLGGDGDGGRVKARIRG
jgi:hypothetical protein